MKPSFGSSLKTRIAIVAGLLFLAGIVIVSLVVSSILHKEMQALLSGQQLAAAHYVGREISGKLSLRLESLKRVAGNIPQELLNNPPALQSWLDDRRAIHTLFPTGLMVIPPDGGPTIADTPRLETRPKSFTDRDWFIGVKKTGRAFISKPLIARATGEPALVIAVPILDQDQRLQGVLAGVTPLATPGFLDQIIGAQPGNNGSYQLIATKSRLFVLGSNLREAVTELPPSGSDPVIDAALNDAPGIRTILNAQGEEELAAIVDVPPANWRLLARQPARDAFEPVRNTLTNSWLITALLSFPIIGVLLLALSHLLKPLGQLADELRGMAEGTRPMQPLKLRHNDEVARVASSFNHLQHKLLEQERSLAEMAHRDALTQLPNRLAINDCLERELARIQRTGSGLALLFLDLDGFKPVNDTYGHDIGDLLLIEIARRLRGCVRDIDTVARLGGDEFLICLGDTEAPLSAGERVATECIEALGKPFYIGGHIISVGVSIGLAIANGEDDGQTESGDLLRYADHAMYRAKANGRNRYAIYSPELTSPDYV